FIAKVNDVGNTLWAKGLQGTGDVNAFSLALDDSANIYVTGAFQGIIDFNPDTIAVFNMNSGGVADQDMFVLKLSPDGEFLWAKQIGTDSYLETNIRIDPSNNILICGQAVGLTDFDPGPAIYYPYGFPSNCGYILKLDRNGNFIWAIGFDGPYSIVTSVDYDAFGNIIACGKFSSFMDLDPGPGADTLWENGNFNASFMVRLNQNGNYLYGGGFYSTNICNATRVSCNPSGSFFIAGEFRDTMDIDPDTS